MVAFLRNFAGLWLLVRQYCGISARVERHQIKWERRYNGISARFPWLPVVRWGCIVVGISAGYSRPPVEWLGRVTAKRHCCMVIVTLPIGAATGWHFCAPVVAPK